MSGGAEKGVLAGVPLSLSVAPWMAFFGLFANL